MQVETTAGYPPLLEIHPRGIVRAATSAVRRVVGAVLTWRARRAIARLERLQEAKAQFELVWNALVFAAKHDESLTSDERYELLNEYWDGARRFRKQIDRARCDVWRACTLAGEWLEQPQAVKR